MVGSLVNPVNARLHTHVCRLCGHQERVRHFVGTTLVRLHDIGVRGLVWSLLSNFLCQAVSCQISGSTRALLKGGSCPHSFSISWWTALQQRSSLLLQESICLGTVSVGSRINCTLMIWWLCSPLDLQTALNAVHRWGCRSASNLVLAPPNQQ